MEVDSPRARKSHTQRMFQWMVEGMGPRRKSRVHDATGEREREVRHQWSLCTQIADVW